MALKTISNYSFNYNKRFYDELKIGENDFKIALKRNRYNLVRLDGASFSKQFKLRYARFAKKMPYNPYLAFAMQETAMDTMKEFPFISYAYSFSDEISFLIDNALIDFRKMNTLEKMISILSSFVSSAFNANLAKVTSLDERVFYDDEGKLNMEVYKHYEPFLKNSMYLLNVAKKNQIPLNKSGIEKAEDIEPLYQYYKFEVEKRLRKPMLLKSISVINDEMPFDEAKNHIFYFDARLISFDSEDKVYDYFKARQGFAVYKFVEDFALSVVDKVDKSIINSSNKTTNMYFWWLYNNKVPISVYNVFDESIRLGTSFYKMHNTIEQCPAKELKKVDDEKLIDLISNMIDEEGSVVSKANFKKK
ncbi:MAG: tRNA(His) guanylyltransferase Thg1 family protein [Christensenellales bacterium]